jgi:hypothetical protein
MGPLGHKEVPLHTHSMPDQSQSPQRWENVGSDPGLLGISAQHPSKGLQKERPFGQQVHAWLCREGVTQTQHCHNIQQRSGKRREGRVGGKTDCDATQGTSVPPPTPIHTADGQTFCQGTEVMKKGHLLYDATYMKCPGSISPRDRQWQRTGDAEGLLWVQGFLFLGDVHCLTQ